MIIIRIHGGLGNQMFQYALYVALTANGRNVLVDAVENVVYLDSINQSDIFKIFGINDEKLQAKQNEISNLKIIKSDFISKIRRKIFGYKGTWYFESEEGCYDSNIEHISNAYLDGYWQTEKYFIKHRERLLETFAFNKKISDDCSAVLHKIEHCPCAVSVHIRMGDYLRGANADLYGGICTDNYYEKAIEYFEKKYLDCSFFIFSDDKEYIRKYESKNNCYIVNCADEYDAWADMMLMSKCKHNIIANSSFSWWGAWLNEHKDKEVIAPIKWINGKKMRDICPEGWIRI